jgi:hypothetical protein
VSAVSDKLREAKALIEKGWTQHLSAADELGMEVDKFDPAATCFCLYGAFDRAFSVQPIANCEAGWRFLKDAIGEPQPIGWNDRKGRTQAEVLAAFDRAIALAEQEAGQ